jgi:hypothetical protein
VLNIALSLVYRLGTGLYIIRKPNLGTNEIVSIVYMRSLEFCKSSKQGQDVESVNIYLVTLETTETNYPLFY